MFKELMSQEIEEMHLKGQDFEKLKQLLMAKLTVWQQAVQLFEEWPTSIICENCEREPRIWWGKIPRGISLLPLLLELVTSPSANILKQQFMIRMIGQPQNGNKEELQLSSLTHKLPITKQAMKIGNKENEKQEHTDLREKP